MSNGRPRSVSPPVSSPDVVKSHYSAPIEQENDYCVWCLNGSYDEIDQIEERLSEAGRRMAERLGIKMRNRYDMPECVACRKKNIETVDDPKKTEDDIKNDDKSIKESLLQGDDKKENDLHDKKILLVNSDVIMEENNVFTEENSLKEIKSDIKSNEIPHNDLNSLNNIEDNISNKKKNENVNEQNSNNHIDEKLLLDKDEKNLVFSKSIEKSNFNDNSDELANKRIDDNTIQKTDSTITHLNAGNFILLKKNNSNQSIIDKDNENPNKTNDLKLVIKNSNDTENSISVNKEDHIEENEKIQNFSTENKNSSSESSSVGSVSIQDVLRSYSNISQNQRFKSKEINSGINVQDHKKTPRSVYIVNKIRDSDLETEQRLNSAVNETSKIIDPLGETIKLYFNKNTSKSDLKNSSSNDKKIKSASLHSLESENQKVDNQLNSARPVDEKFKKQIINLIQNDEIHKTILKNLPDDSSTEKEVLKEVESEIEIRIQESTDENFSYEKAFSSCSKKEEKNKINSEENLYTCDSKINSALSEDENLENKKILEFDDQNVFVATEENKSETIDENVIENKKESKYDDQKPSKHDKKNLIFEKEHEIIDDSSLFIIEDNIKTIGKPSSNSTNKNYYNQNVIKDQTLLGKKNIKNGGMTQKNVNLQPLRLITNLRTQEKRLSPSLLHQSLVRSVINSHAVPIKINKFKIDQEGREVNYEVEINSKNNLTPSQNELESAASLLKMENNFEDLPSADQKQKIQNIKVLAEERIDNKSSYYNYVAKSPKYIKRFVISNKDKVNYIDDIVAINDLKFNIILGKIYKRGNNELFQNNWFQLQNTTLSCFNGSKQKITEENVPNERNGDIVCPNDKSCFLTKKYSINLKVAQIFLVLCPKERNIILAKMNCRIFNKKKDEEMVNLANRNIKNVVKLGDTYKVYIKNQDDTETIYSIPRLELSIKNNDECYHLRFDNIGRFLKWILAIDLRQQKVNWPIL
ncbi:hypothetical protein GVAV_002622 [Gurleya vavrai]